MKSKKTKTKKDYYGRINEALLSYETFKPYHPLSIDWICDRIDWCWKFRHITEQQMNELCDRIVAVMDGEFA